MYACENKLFSTLFLCPLNENGAGFTDIVRLEVKKKFQLVKYTVVRKKRRMSLKLNHKTTY